jgi:hypothetical protein
MEKILFISSSTQDKKTWILTIIVCGFTLLLFCTLLISITYIMAAMFLLFLFISVAGLISTPNKYILTNTHLIIKRHRKDIYIALSEIQEIRLLSNREQKNIRNSTGCVGPFGHHGTFSTFKFRKLNVYARRFNNWVLIITDHKKYVIAPDDLQLIEATAKEISLTDVDLQTQPYTPVKNWSIVVTVAITLLFILLLYFPYREPKVEFDSNTFKLKGIYGVSIPLTGIAEVDTITWREMPAISLRTNGISLLKTHRGHFKTTHGDRVRLSVIRGINPIIRIVDNNGVMYYINRKNVAETRQIFNEINRKITSSKEL